MNITKVLAEEVANKMVEPLHIASHCLTVPMKNVLPD